ncbi:MAG: DNA polymerase III subunit delta [Bacteroidales bacterium]|nr:DNA polymerase III subunit delta [Bacteroidales bacterium]
MAKGDSKITEKQLISDLKAGQFAPIYLLTGEENYYIDLVSDYMENNIISDDFKDLAQTILYGRDVVMEEVIEKANNIPMLSPIQLIMVKEAQDIGKSRNKTVADWDALVKYLEHPHPYTILVLCYRHAKMDKRTKAYKTISEKGVIYERNKLRDDEIPGWVSNIVSQKGYSITQRGAMMIAEALGNDLGKISNELSKIYITHPAGSAITEEVIERNIGISKDYNVFELQNAIGRRDVERCNRIVNYFAANPKANPIQMVLPSLYGYFIKVMIFIQEPDKKVAAQKMGINPFFIRDYEAAARNYTLGKLASCIGYLHETDLRSKGVRNSGTTTDGELLKELVFKIIH